MFVSFFPKVVTFSVLSILSAAFTTCLIGIALPGAILYSSGSCKYVYYTTSTTSNYNYYYSDSGYYDCSIDGKVILTKLI